MYDLAIDKLAAAGYKQYEISNFAKPSFECQHNLNYWVNGSYVGIGPSAASYIGGTRTKNISDIDKYIEIVNKGNLPIEESETLSAVERACETAVLNLRRISGINLSQFKQQTDFDALKLFAEPIERFVKMGILEKDENKISIARDALAVADSILCEFSQI
jgi:oxygen-independent coproporphyrinogen-3 oxidase